MLILENIVFSTQKIGGISVVWHEHISRLLKDQSMDAKFIEYNGSENNILRRKMTIPQDRLIERSSLLMKYRRFFNPRLNYPGPFIFHSSDYRVARNRKAINIVTVHDFIYFMNVPKGLYKWLVKWIHCYQMANAIRKADYVICISHNTKNDLLRYIPGIDEKKTRVIHNGVSDAYRPVTDPDISFIPFEIKKYVMFVGSRSRYKNFRLTVEAVSESEFSLVIIGSRLNEEEKAFVREKLGDNRYFCINTIETADLNKLYNGAYCLLYPSSYEGFGIPVLEAQRAGCPVIAFNASSIPEVIGETPLLLDELSVEKIRAGFQLLRDENRRNQIIEEGFRNAEQFSWDRTYEKVSKLYTEIEGSISAGKK